VRVLLVNDDGVYAEGLHALRRRLEAAGVDVYVAAPERERSAMSHAITLHKPLHVGEASLPDLRRPVWAISGTPADCTKLAILSLMEERPDLVVSGINRGANVGLDVLYSGTVSAAIEGVILGIPSLAVSLARFEDPDFGPAAELAARLVLRLPPRPEGERPFLLNVNVPACAAGEMAGVALTRLGVRQYTDVIHPRRDPRGRAYYWLAGRPRDASDEPGADVWALARNLVSITPLHLDLTDEPLRRSLRPWAETLLSPE
jgi:5'-nucleotidase